MASIFQGQAINSYYFRHNRGNFVFFGVYHGVLGYAVHNGVVRKYLRHCIVGEKSKMAAICQCQAINSYHFRHNRDRFVFSVQTLMAIERQIWL